MCNSKLYVPYRGGYNGFSGKPGYEPVRLTVESVVDIHHQVFRSSLQYKQMDIVKVVSTYIHTYIATIPFEVVYTYIHAYKHTYIQYIHTQSMDMA